MSLVSSACQDCICVAGDTHSFMFVSDDGRDGKPNFPVGVSPQRWEFNFKFNLIHLKSEFISGWLAKCGFWA